MAYGYAPLSTLFASAWTVITNLLVISFNFTSVKDRYGDIDAEDCSSSSSSEEEDEDAEVSIYRAGCTFHLFIQDNIYTFIYQEGVCCSLVLFFDHRILNHCRCITFPADYLISHHKSLLQQFDNFMTPLWMGWFWFLNCWVFGGHIWMMQALTPQLEKDWLKTLTAIKTKDPRIYDKSAQFYHSESSSTGDSDGEPASTHKKKQKPNIPEGLWKKSFIGEGRVRLVC